MPLLGYILPCPSLWTLYVSLLGPYSQNGPSKFYELSDCPEDWDLMAHLVQDPQPGLALCELSSQTAQRRCSWISGAQEAQLRGPRVSRPSYLTIAPTSPAL